MPHFIILSLFFFGSLICLPSLGQNDQKPLLVKINSPGYVPDDYFFKETCKLYRDRVEIEYQFSGKTITENRHILGNTSLEAVVSKAKQEELTETPNLICDLPSTKIYGLDSSGAEVLLYATGSCGTPKQERAGGAAFTLMSLIGKYCPETF